MEIKKRTPDLETVFNARWEANNYNKNGFKEMTEQRQDHFNRLYNIKSKEQQKKEKLLSKGGLNYAREQRMRRFWIR